MWSLKHLQNFYHQKQITNSSTTATSKHQIKCLTAAFSSSSCSGCLAEHPFHLGWLECPGEIPWAQLFMPSRALLCLAGFKVRIFLETLKLTVTQFYRIHQRGLELVKGLPMIWEGYTDKVPAPSLQVSPFSTLDFSPLFSSKTDSMMLLCM